MELEQRETQYNVEEERERKISSFVCACLYQVFAAGLTIYQSMYLIPFKWISMLYSNQHIFHPAKKKQANEST